MSIKARRLNLKQTAQQLLRRECFLSNEDKNQLQQSLKNVLYELQKLQLQQAFVADGKHYSEKLDYDELGELICRVNNRILVLHLEAVKAYLAADKERRDTWNKHRGEIMAQYKTHVLSNEP